MLTISPLFILLITLTTASSPLPQLPLIPPHSPPSPPPVPLHILPIGDSITQGFRSTDSNGYRLFLRSLLSQSPDPQNDLRRVLYLGSQHSGNMTNNAHEGYGGFTITQIAEAVRKYLVRGRDGETEETEETVETKETERVLWARPNVVLVHAGTNDLNMDPAREPWESAPTRLEKLVDEVLCVVPDAVVVLAEIVQSTFEGTRERIERFNSKVPGIVEERVKVGCKVLVGDMSSIGADGENLADGLHPDDAGYEAMAKVWYSALEDAELRGWISAPEQDVESRPRCSRC